MYYMGMDWGYLVKGLKYFVYDKKSFIKYFAFSIIVAVLEIFGIALTYPFVIGILSPQNNSQNHAIIIGTLIVLAFLIKNLFMIFYTAFQSNFVQKNQTYLNKKFVEYFIKADYNETSKIPYAKKIQILNSLIPNSTNNFLMRLLNLIVNIFIFNLITIFLFVKFFYPTLVTIICAVTLLTIQTIFLKLKSRFYSESITKAGELVNKTLQTPLLNIKNIKITNSEKYFFKKYSLAFEDFQSKSQKLLFFNAIPPFITEPFVIIMLLLLLIMISTQNITSPDTLVASYAVIISAMFRLAPTISRIQVNITGIENAKPMLKELIKYYEDFGLNDSISSKLNDLPQEYTEVKNSIELKNVSFAYNEKLVLKNINLKINKGDFVGIVGASGAGKTTLIDIIDGLLRVKEGELYIDSVFVGNRMPKLKIGYIPQEYSVIPGSIRENVAFRDENIDDAKVMDALKKARILDFITTNFKEGIYANPFIDSVGFSQGQKQRLAIARAFYCNPDIIILDEATSSLDLKTEDEICELLNTLKGEKTIIAIAHRLSTIKSADKIVYMEDSSIADIGSYEYMYQNNDKFRELVKLNNTNSIH